MHHHHHSAPFAADSRPQPRRMGRTGISSHSIIYTRAFCMPRMRIRYVCYFYAIYLPVSLLAVNFRVPSLVQHIPSRIPRCQAVKYCSHSLMPSTIASFLDSVPTLCTHHTRFSFLSVPIYSLPCTTPQTLRAAFSPSTPPAFLCTSSSSQITSGTTSSFPFYTTPCAFCAPQTCVVARRRSCRSLRDGSRILTCRKGGGN